MPSESEGYVLGDDKFKKCHTPTSEVGEEVGLPTSWRSINLSFPYLGGRGDSKQVPDGVIRRNVGASQFFMPKNPIEI